MKRIRQILILISVAIALLGCQAPKGFAPQPTDYVPLAQVVIEDQFVKSALTANNILGLIRACVPTYTGAGSNHNGEKFPFSANAIHSIGHQSSVNQFVVDGNQGVCVRQSSQKYPIWASEMIEKTVNPNAVPEQIQKEWNKKIALTIAAKGRANVVYAYKNGNANFVSYWADPSANYLARIFYASEFKRAGEWTANEDMLVLTHPTLLSVSVTKRGETGSMVKSIFSK